MYCCGKIPRYIVGWKNKPQNSTDTMILSVYSSRYKLDYAQKICGSVHRESVGSSYL